MITNPTLGAKIIEKASKISPEMLTIPVVSGYSIYERYKLADKSDKKNVIIRDMLVLGASGAGIVAGSKISNKLIKPENLKNIRNDILNGICTPISGLIGGIAAGEVAERLFPAKYPQLQQDIKQVILKKIENLEKPQSAQDKQETEEQKQKNKVKNTIKSIGVFTFTFIGILSGSALSKQILKLKTLTQKNLDSTAQDAIKLSSILIGGCIGNIASRNVLNNLLPSEKNKRLNLSDTSMRHFNLINYEVNSFMNRTLPSVSGFDTGREVGLENKVKRGFNDIISGIIIPAAVILPTANITRSAIAAKKIPVKLMDKVIEHIPFSKIREKYQSNAELKNQLVEKAVLFPVTIAGLYAGETAGEWFKKRIVEKISKEAIVKHLPDLKQDLMKAYLKSIGDKNDVAKKNVVAELAKVNQLEQEIKAKKD